MNAYIVATAVALVVAAAGGYATDVGPWYRGLKKPTWNPPDWLFAPAWTVIYAVTVWAAGTLWYNMPSDQRVTGVLLPFAINALLNMGWSFVFFKMKHPVWAAVEVIALWLSTAWLLIIASSYSPLATGLLTIYLGWVTFATALNFSLVLRNPNAHKASA